MPPKAHDAEISALDIELDQPGFFGDVGVTLAAELEETIGVVEASAFVGQVGDKLGDDIGAAYSKALGTLPKEPRRLAEILVDLKDRIGGRFQIEKATEEEIVLVNARCPFGKRVVGHSSLCMMTTSVFGRIVSDARGFARIRIEDAIASGHPTCRVVIQLKDGPGTDGHDFYG